MLQKLNFKPGFNKMVTDSGGESQWVDGDFVRFRYGLPEKIGGWSQLTNSNNTLPGVARAQHDFTSIAGERYVAIGTWFIRWKIYNFFFCHCANRFWLCNIRF
jgi:hypothetical protein